MSNVIVSNVIYYLFVVSYRNGIFTKQLLQRFYWRFPRMSVWNFTICKILTVVDRIILITFLWWQDTWKNYNWKYLFGKQTNYQ